MDPYSPSNIDDPMELSDQTSCLPDTIPTSQNYPCYSPYLLSNGRDTSQIMQEEVTTDEAGSVQYDDSTTSTVQPEDSTSSSGSVRSVSSSYSDSNPSPQTLLKTEAEETRKNDINVISQPCPEPLPFKGEIANKKETANEKLERIKNCMTSFDYDLMAETIKTVDSAVIASSVPQESIIRRKRPISEISSGTAVEFKEYRKCSIYLHPNLNKLQVQFQNHLRSLRLAEAVIEDYLDIKNEEPRGFPIPGYVRTNDNLSEWRNSEFSYDVSISTASRIPMCTCDPSPYQSWPDCQLDTLLEFIKPFYKYSDDILMDIVKMREEGLNFAVDLQNIFKSADEDFSLQECDSENSSETSEEKCSYCLDFIKEYVDESNDSINVSNEEGEDAIEERIECLLKELKITNASNNAVKDKLTARFIQTREKISLEKDIDENAKQMWDLFTSHLKELQIKENEMTQREIEKREFAESSEKEEKEILVESINIPLEDSHLLQPVWDADIKARRKKLVSDYQRFKSKKNYNHMNEILIDSLNKILRQKYPGKFKKQKTVKRHLRSKKTKPAPICIKLKITNS